MSPRFGDLRVSEELYKQRLDRMRRLIELNAPRAVICMEARLLSSCFHYPLSKRLHDFKMKKFPHWLLWLTSVDYRAVCREPLDDDAIQGLAETIRTMSREEGK